MYCNNCQKEIEGEFLFCPHCGNSIQQEIVPVENVGGDSEEKKQNNTKKYEKKLKKLKKEYWWKKIKRIDMPIITFILFVVMVLCSLFFIYSVYRRIGITEYERVWNEYDSKIQEYEVKKSELEVELEKKIEEQKQRVELENKRKEQEKKIELANYETQFEKEVLQGRENKVQSFFVSDENKDKINEYIKDLYRYSESKIEQDSLNGESYYLIKDYIMLEEHSLTDSTNNAIYPGAILKGDSLFKGDYTVIPIEKTAIDLMSNQSNGTTKTVLNPNYSNVTKILNEYADEYLGDVSKEWKHQMIETSTSQELNLSLGLGTEECNVGIGANSSNKNSQMAVVYTQIYYTVSVEPKNNAFDYFEKGTDLSVLGGYAPAYVSSVDYGRKIMLVISSDLSQEELSAKVSGMISGVPINAGIEHVVKDEKLTTEIYVYGGEDATSVLENSNSNLGIIGEIKKFVNGGEDEQTVLDRVNAFIANGNKLTNPLPVSYDLKYLSDNAPVPAMYINREEVMLTEDTQIITLSSRKNKEFTIDISALPAILINEKEVVYKNGKATGSYFELLCKDLEYLPMEILYKKDRHSVDLAENEFEEIFNYDLGMWNYIDIYKTKFAEHYIQ